MERTVSPGLFSVFEDKPALVREFLYSALQLRHLEALYEEAREAGAGGFADAMLARLDVSIDVPEQDLARIPTDGPFVLVANHPYGFLDGLVLDSLLRQSRRDTKVLTNALLCGFPELAERCLPVDVFGGPQAVRENARSIRQGLEWLKQGGGVAIFPAGEVSHWCKNEHCVTDPPWNEFPVRLARAVGAPTVPVYFEGSNSLAFQLSGFVHPRLRTARLPGELLNKRGRTVHARLGNPIPAAELERQGDGERATAYIRARTYMLRYRKKSSSAPRPRLAVFPSIKKQEIEPVALPGPGVEAEIERLQGSSDHVLCENETYAVYADRGEAIPKVVREIGRLRELTFRAVQEGTGKALDLDRFDPYYTHLILWHKRDRAIAGAYRLAWTRDILPQRGVNGLYTSTLFRFSQAFFTQLGPAVELGRSFIRPEYQRDYAPLFLLFQGISRCVHNQPDSHILFGAVSISAEYSAASRELMVQFLRERSYRSDLAKLAAPRHPFRNWRLRGADIGLLAKCLSNVEDLSAPIADLGDPSNVPVLLRHYLRLGGKVAGFNVDRNFGNALDGLLILDLSTTPQKLLGKYMGADEAARFLLATRSLQSA